LNLISVIQISNIHFILSFFFERFTAMPRFVPTQTRKHWFALVSSMALTWGSIAIMHAPQPVWAQPGTNIVRGLPDFTELVEQVGPSVVNIRTLEKVKNSSSGFGGVPDEQMLEFFRRFGIPLPPGSQRSPRQERGGEQERPTGVGSGFILTSDGFIMTNAHVVEGADELIVTLPDKREFKARVIGADKRTDVAMVKIEALGLPAVKIGDANRIKVGEWVMAIGSPFGLENSVTAGIVSAKQRDTGDYLPFIQTDVAINPGNSGGPLINLRGEVIGINSQIYSRSGGFMGISFAIPIDEAMRVAEQLRSTGKVTRGRIGVSIDSVSKDVAESLGLNEAKGALVRGVEPDSPAARAGVEAGDIIIKFDGRTIDKSVDLPRLVGNTKPGTRSTITVFRRGTAKDLSILVGEVEPEQRQATRRNSPENNNKSVPATAAKNLGLTLSDLTDLQRSELKIKGGVRVETAESFAARAGLREGDVILAIANTEVNSVRDVETILSRIDKNRSIGVLVRRGDWAQYVVIPPQGR
jgi:serine protease Do